MPNYCYASWKLSCQGDDNRSCYYFSTHHWRYLLGRFLSVVIILGISSCQVPLETERSDVQLSQDFSEAESASEVVPSSRVELSASISERRERIGIPEGLFNQLVDEVFYEQNPDMKDRVLTFELEDAEWEDAEWRSLWLESAAELLYGLEHLPHQKRLKLGSYQQTNYDQWRQELKHYSLSEKAFVHLADAQFHAMFPQYRGKHLNPETAGQIWYVIADELMQALQSGENLEVIRYAYPGSDEGYSEGSQGLTSGGLTTCEQDRCQIRRSHVLNLARGVAYVIWLEQGMVVNLTEISSGHTNCTIIKPDHAKLDFCSLEEEVSETGYYEILVTPDGLDDTENELIFDIYKTNDGIWISVELDKSSYSRVVQSAY